MTRTTILKSAGLAGITFFLVHAFGLILTDSYHHLLWSCHLGCLLVGFGLLLPNARIYAVGGAWMVLGVPLWLLNVVVTGEFMPTSFLSHIGGLMLAIFGVRQLGIPRFTWLVATMSLLGLGILTRLLTPAVDNINLAFKVWSGWEKVFPSYFWYICMMMVLAALVFFLFEKLSLQVKKN